MTRAYICIKPIDGNNYLCIYKNGDQYPLGVLSDYGFAEFAKPHFNGTTREILSWLGEFYPDCDIDVRTNAIFDSLTDWNYRLNFAKHGAGRKDALEAEVYNWENRKYMQYAHDDKNGADFVKALRLLARQD